MIDSCWRDVIIESNVPDDINIILKIHVRPLVINVGFIFPGLTELWAMEDVDLEQDEMELVAAAAAGSYFY